MVYYKFGVSYFQICINYRSTMYGYLIRCHIIMQIESKYNLVNYGADRQI